MFWLAALAFRLGRLCIPAVRVSPLTIQCAFLAVCMLVTPLLMAGWFVLCPEYGDPRCRDEHLPLAAMAAFRAANPVLMQAFIWINVLVPYLFPLGYLALGLVAIKRSPWLAMLGIACGWLGSVPWGLIADQNLLLHDIAQLSADGVFSDLPIRYFGHWEILVMAGGWVIGHLLAYVFLGIVFGRAGLVPVWSAAMIVAAAPVMGPLAYGTHSGVLQVAGFLLVFVGSIPAARLVLAGQGSSALAFGEYDPARHALAQRQLADATV